MARPQKSGLDYFPHDTENDTKIEALLLLYGGVGYAFYFIHLEYIYKSKDFELDTTDEETNTIIRRKLKITKKKYDEIMATCLRKDCFNKSHYEKTKKLTSDGIKRRASMVVDKRDRMRKRYKAVSDAETPAETGEETPQELEKKPQKPEQKPDKEKHVFKSIDLKHEEKHAPKKKITVHDLGLKHNSDSGIKYPADFEDFYTALINWFMITKHQRLLPITEKNVLGYKEDIYNIVYLNEKEDMTDVEKHIDTMEFLLEDCKTWNGNKKMSIKFMCSDKYPKHFGRKPGDTPASNGGNGKLDLQARTSFNDDEYEITNYMKGTE